MRLHLRRALGLATAALLAAGSVLAAVPAHAELDPGEISVTFLDHTGKPTPAYFSVVDTDGDQRGTSTAPDSRFVAEVPPGRYGLIAIAPTAGMMCAGFSDCDFYLTSVDVPGVVDVASGERAEYTFRAPRPATLHGSGRLGTVLSVELSEAMDRLINGVAFGMIGGFGGFGGMRTEWLRNGKVIRGESSDAYTVRRSDVGRTISPRLQYPRLLKLLLEDAGFDVPAVSIPGAAVPQVKPQVKTAVFRKNRIAGKRTGTRIDVTARGQIVTGKVRIKVGAWTKTKRLANGSTRVRLPKLKAGKHTVQVTYLGTRVFAKTKAKKVTYRVIDAQKAKK